MRLRDIARVELAPDERRGLAELNGDGEVVGGIVVARYGTHALDVIHNVKDQASRRSRPDCRRASRIETGLRPLGA